MSRSGILGVIPARLASTRLPRKPLQPILGRPLLEWVWRRVMDMRIFDELVVATDSPEVAKLCEALGAPVQLTAPDHPSGTDRVAEVCRLPRYSSYDVVVNVQGDEPLVAEGHLARAAALVGEGSGGWDVGTCAAPVGDRDAWMDPSVVKVARASDGRALYFSRAPIPWPRDRGAEDAVLTGPLFLRHVGIYAYRREALHRWVQLPPSALEEMERLEQLRPLEAGMRIGVDVVARAQPGVDTPADVERVERELSNWGDGLRMASSHDR